MKQRRFLLILFILALGCLTAVWVVGADQTNLIQNPSFEYPAGVRSFAYWEHSGCADWVEKPKPAAVKWGPPYYDGECAVGETGVISQTFGVVGLEVISYTHKEMVRNAGNHLVVIISDGEGWSWTARDTTAVNTSFEFTPIVTTTLPVGADELTIRIEGTYQNNLGIKVSAVTVTGH